jgi:hypothetical protein
MQIDFAHFGAVNAFTTVLRIAGALSLSLQEIGIRSFRSIGHRVDSGVTRSTRGDTNTRIVSSGAPTKLLHTWFIALSTRKRVVALRPGHGGKRPRKSLRARYGREQRCDLHGP